MVDGKWTHIAEIPIVKEKGGVVTEIPVEAEGVRQVRILYDRKSGKGSVAVDDIDVAYGVTLQDVPVEGKIGINTGDVTSYLVDGLLPQTRYFYNVKGTDGEQTSLVSNEIAVMTAEKVESGLSFAQTAESGIFVNGRTLRSAQSITVFTVSGAYVGTTLPGQTLTLPAPGVYLIRSGLKTFKVSLK